MRKARTEMREVEVVDYYAEVGDVITIPGKRGRFVVEEAEMTGGGYAQGNDYYPDAWHVKVRLLRKKRCDAKDGVEYKYNPKARLFEFTQNTTSFNTVIEGVEQVGQMVKVVDFQQVEDQQP